ncbi:hypothetical protein MMC09_002682 [Bachmanniomyces sp. S44760]|nr:hypothetical protein [Bachmanniomyces sp. S44760]
MGPEEFMALPEAPHVPVPGPTQVIEREPRQGPASSIVRQNGSLKRYGKKIEVVFNANIPFLKKKAARSPSLSPVTIERIPLPPPPVVYQQNVPGPYHALPVAPNHAQPFREQPNIPQIVQIEPGAPRGRPYPHVDQRPPVVHNVLRNDPERIVAGNVHRRQPRPASVYHPNDSAHRIRELDDRIYELQQQLRHRERLADRERISHLLQEIREERILLEGAGPAGPDRTHGVRFDLPRAHRAIQPARAERDFESDGDRIIAEAVEAREARQSGYQHRNPPVNAIPSRSGTNSGARRERTAWDDDYTNNGRSRNI